jgi:hypothetical protein
MQYDDKKLEELADFVGIKIEELLSLLSDKKTPERSGNVIYVDFGRNDHEEPLL